MNSGLLAPAETVDTSASAGALAPVAETGELRVDACPIDGEMWLKTSPLYWDWRQLAQSDYESQVAQHPDFVLRELQCDTSCAGELKAAWLVRACRGARTEAIALLVPKVIRAKSLTPFAPNWQLSGYRLAGNRILGDQSQKVQDAIFENIGTILAERRADFLLIEELDVRSPLHRMAEADDCPGNLQRFVPIPFQARHRIVFPKEAEGYWSTISPKSRNTLRRKVKRFGTGRFVKVTQPADIPELLETAHRISLKSWQTHQLGLRIHDDAAELQKLTILAELGALRSYLLYYGDTPAAFLIGTQFNDCYNYEEVGYDQDLAGHSPGQVLLMRVLDDLLATDRPHVLDFGGGDAEYKRLFSTDVSLSGNVWLMPETRRTRTIMALLNGCLRTEHGIRRFLEWTGLTGKVRSLLRRGTFRKQSGECPES